MHRNGYARNSMESDPSTHFIYVRGACTRGVLTVQNDIFQNGLIYGENEKRNRSQALEGTETAAICMRSPIGRKKIGDRSSSVS